MLLPNIPFISTQISSPLCLFLITGQDKVTAEIVRRKTCDDTRFLFSEALHRVEKWEKEAENFRCIISIFFPFHSIQPPSAAGGDHAFAKPQRAKPSESKDSGFQGSVNRSYFSLRQLTRGKKGKARDRHLKDAKDYNIWGIQQGTWVVKVCLEMESHSSPDWSTSGLAISPMWPDYCAFLLQNVNQWGKGGELSNSGCWSSAMQFLYIPMGGRAKRDIWKPLTDSLHCKAETNTTL